MSMMISDKEPLYLKKTDVVMKKNLLLGSEYENSQNMQAGQLQPQTQQRRTIKSGQVSSLGIIKPGASSLNPNK